MSTLTANISLDEGLKAFVEADAAATGCASVSEYMRSLIEARKREKQDYDAAVKKMKKLIQDGIDSGLTEQPWEEHKRELMAKIGRHRRAENGAGRRA